jgi:hypothetical protein
MKINWQRDGWQAVNWQMLLVAAMLLSVPVQSGASSSGYSIDVEALRKAALNFVLQSQFKTDSASYRKGEWQSTVQSDGFLAREILGTSSEPIDDPNSFVIASIHNLLGNIYLEHRAEPEILPVLTAARDAMREYEQQQALYNFWPRSPRFSNGIHFPRNDIVNKGWQGMLAMPPDADTNASVQQMFCVWSRISEEQCRYVNTAEFEPYTRFRDIDRPIPHLHNLLLDERNTGAFMTFFEAEPALPTFFNAFAPPQQGVRVPAEKNTVDCVVNSNVLRALTQFGKTDVPGYADACRLLQKQVREKQWNSCGNYYPVTYTLHYSIAEAVADGVQCLQSTRKTLTEHILASQQTDGSWRNELIERDDVQASAFALNALLLLGDRRDERAQRSILRGVRYLAAQAQPSGREAFWRGGVFFSAGLPVFRREVLWRSTPYTTALVARALYLIDEWSLPDLRLLSQAPVAPSQPDDQQNM